MRHYGCDFLNFNPLPPYGGRLNLSAKLTVSNHFNPLPPYGGRLQEWGLVSTSSRFQSTPSVWRETNSPWRLASHESFQSTPSVWRETHMVDSMVSGRNISIHSLRMEGDGFPEIHLPLPAYFNPLPPYGGRRGYAVNGITSNHISIHSLRMEGDISTHWS